MVHLEPVIVVSNALAYYRCEGFSSREASTETRLEQVPQLGIAVSCFDVTPRGEQEESK